MWRASLLLVVLLGGAARADGFDDIVSSVNHGNHDEVCARMGAFVARNPADVRVPRGVLWMGEVRRNEGRNDLARPYFERVVREAPASEWALHARKGLADIDLDEHQYDRAIATYDALARLPSAQWQYIGSNARDFARAEQLRFRILLALAALLASTIAAHLLLAARARTLWPIPRELVWVLPVLLLVVAGSFSQEPPEGAALRLLVAGALLLVWTHGAVLRSGRATWLPALSGALGSIALLYCALVANGLWGKLADTIAMGAE